MKMTNEENAACNRFCHCLLEMLQRYGSIVQEERKKEQEVTAPSEGKQ